MPPLPKKTICRVCGAITENRNGLCDEHQKKDEDERREYSRLYDRRRGSPSSRGYNSAWIKFRKQFLREHPLCVQCESEGRIIPATEIHHIKTLRDGGSKYDENNLMPLCHICHSRITMTESVNGKRF